MRRKAFFSGFFFGFMVFLVSSGIQHGAAGQEGSSRSIPLTVCSDKIRGGFLGQMVGVTYGVPFEFRFNRRMVPEEKLSDWEPKMILGPFMQPKVLGALGQDDIYVELTFLQTIERHGLDVPIEQIGSDFAGSRYPLWHANRAARNNLRAGIMPPLSGHPRYNQHADDIDFQIEADIFGLICPGMPQAVQDITWRFGHVMNYGDGVYGGVFISGMYSAAFFEDDRIKVVESGLALIPEESNYARTIMDVLDAYRKNPGDWRAAWQLIEDNWGSKDMANCPGRLKAIGANINGAYVVIGLLYGEGDPIKTMRIATMCGRDADCNPASALGVLGTMIGYKRLPESFKSELPGMAGKKFAYTIYDYEGAVQAIERQARAMVIGQGGEEKGQDLLFPVQAPGTLPLEQWPYGMPAGEVPLPSE